MKKMIRGVMAVLVLASGFALHAQTQTPASTDAQTSAQAAPTADEVVGKYVEAIGGKAAIGQVKSISMETSVQVMGNDAPGTTVILDGVGYKSETDFNGSKIVQCYTDKGGWTVNPMAGAADPTPMPDDQYKAGKDQIYIGGPLYDYAAKGSKVELVSKDADTYKIKLTTKDNVESTYVIDAKTYLINSTTRKGQMQGQDVDITTGYSDYRKTDGGYLLPYAMNLDFGGQFQLSIAVKKVELNAAIDPAIFAMPKAVGDAPGAAKPDTTQTKPN